ncbi:hypothetical protein M2459_002156 [Parabacteroides sp. PF5-5]|uniref:hypothetical protein n=1 Tax=unclassified Parabacteroides TaxID=2649774 RepID=UPI0024749D8E|nr:MULTISPECIES: hypothetical protein [unclassified Parabacteroides]MDH6306828.1 hypothetical protein [Parabacteroides sp. PH5-39]MDH6316273.1 hypothetical protein [Parabacteroides sp. PF5-13]MDH6319756.1 hypothetical protein [Parabacteroides sp. PH5-13]MDH6323652.1 hypothetical protein [Parabacteroides sp. PH5-8]MDH6327460.1 hypothetical protein [Parabacteroides sp. PH5-41]
MNLRSQLSQRIGMYDIMEILHQVRQDNSKRQELYDLLLLDDEDVVSYQAAWVFTHFSSKENKWLCAKQDELIDKVLVCKHGGKRRIILNLLSKQTFPNPPRVDFLDFCLERMLSVEELPGVKTLCMKLAYELCRPIPELTQELKLTLELMENDLPPSIRAVRKNTLKAIQKKQE